MVKSAAIEAMFKEWCGKSSSRSVVAPRLVLECDHFTTDQRLKVRNQDRKTRKSKHLAIRINPQNSLIFQCFSPCSVALNRFLYAQVARPNAQIKLKKQNYLLWQKHSPNPKSLPPSPRNAKSPRSKPLRFSTMLRSSRTRTRRTPSPFPDSASSCS